MLERAMHLERHDRVGVREDHARGAACRRRQPHRPRACPELEDAPAGDEGPVRGDVRDEVRRAPVGGRACAHARGVGWRMRVCMLLVVRVHVARVDVHAGAHSHSRKPVRSAMLPASPLALGASIGTAS